MAASGGFGVMLYIGDSYSADEEVEYTEVAAVESVNGVEIEALLDEITTHGSTGGFREMLPTGKSQVADVELGLVFDIAEDTHKNTAGGLTYAMLHESLLGYELVLPDSGTTTWTFDAYVRKMKWAAPQDGKLAATVTLAVTGQPSVA